MTTTTRHLSSQFDQELTLTATQLMEMGGHVETQLRYVTDTINDWQDERLGQIEDLEKKVNQFELDIDQNLATIIATRQPTARDMRLLMSLSKATADLERMGDEATKSARMLRLLFDDEQASTLPVMDLSYAGELVCGQLRQALDAFARMDVSQVMPILNKDKLVNREFEGYTRKLITYMMEDPRKITACMQLLFIAKSIEHIGDHCKSLAQLIVYMVRGKNIRHASPAKLSQALDEHDHYEE